MERGCAAVEKVSGIEIQNKIGELQLDHFLEKRKFLGEVRIKKRGGGVSRRPGEQYPLMTNPFLKLQ
ncbi:MAG: hypothetical protein EBU28_01655 [Gammaproteobacteria bacterium]|nr:hypothetical protein [Gammaproteobacteria bacterium]